jgi:predicted DNA-binding transcriptional regulator YafY
VKSDRLLSALLLLQAHGRLTGREMARRLEVSERTIHRDMDALSAAGIPVLALRGAQGGWQLDEDWRTEVPGLTESELRALLMAQPRTAGDPSLAAAAQSALGKLMAALPLALRDRASAIRARLHIDTSGWLGVSEDLSQLPAVQDAVWRDRKLTFSYWQPPGRTATRTVDPLGMVAKGNTWYLFAATERGYRTYRISRMRAAQALDTPAERPARFDLAAAWSASTDRFQEQRAEYIVVLRVHPEAVEWIQEWQSAEVLEEGPQTLLRIRFHAEGEACFVVLGLGGRAEVVEPEALRAKVKRAVAELSATYNS